MKDTVEKMPLPILRSEWEKVWHQPAHPRLGRKMLEVSLWKKEKSKEAKVEELQDLKKLVRAFRKNPNLFESEKSLKPGVRLVREWRGQRYVVQVVDSGFDYNGQVYGSLSQVANTITGTRWNGKVFFGLKMQGGA